MKAMLLKSLCNLKNNPTPLELTDVPIPTPAATEILIKVSVCGVCHTELDEIEGRTPPPKLPVIPEHQVIGRVAAVGKGVQLFSPEQANAALLELKSGKIRGAKVLEIS